MATRKQPGPVSGLLQDDRNANKGTERGRGLLEASLRKYGAGRSVLTDRNNKLIAGNKTSEIAVDDLGMETIVVETDGTKLVVVKRTDLDLDQDSTARELAFADNRIGQLSLDWDAEALLAASEDEQIDLAGVGFTDAELEDIFRGFPADSPEYDERVAEDITVKARWTLTFRQDMVGIVRDALTKLQDDVPTLAWKEDTTA